MCGELASALVMAVLAACGPSSPHAVPPKAPNNELILGEFERRPPVGTTAARFRADGSVVIAHDRSKLDGPTLASGHWQLDKDQLMLSYDQGMCGKQGPGVYKVVISKVGIHFTKVDDACADRAQIDGETWFRTK